MIGCRSAPGAAVAPFVLLASLAHNGVATAQERHARIFDVSPGMHVTALPARSFVDPSCGTRGGPRGMQIRSFGNFARCAPEAGGLREIWFSYDDTAEFVALARRAPNPRRTTTVLDQPVILSVLIDADGFVQGYRIFTDTRADHDLRMHAHEVAVHFKARFSLDGHCTDLPLAERETPIDGQFVKEICRKETNGLEVTSEARFYYRPGQQFFDPNTGVPMVNSFESSARLEVIARDGRRTAAPSVETAAASEPADARSAFLSGASRNCPGCSLAETDLRHRDLSGADLSGADLEGALLHRTNLSRADLRGARLDGANLNRANMSFARLDKASLVNAMLYQTDLQRAQLPGADLTRVMAGRAQLSFARLDQAKLDGADLGGARANDASFVRASMTNVFLPQAVLARAKMRDAAANGGNFSEARLREADLAGASLRGANLSNSDLVSVNLNHADLTGATLLSSDMAGANTDSVVFSATRMPDNSLQGVAK
jgi:uncharacterized protein YjbI with pentapeptide repeats